jgi:protein O-mannosyl-transferase
MVQVSQPPQGNQARAANKGGRRLARALSPAVWVSLLLASAVLLVFWPAVRCGFTNFDDPGYYSENAHVLAGLSWSNVKWALRTTEYCSWYPVTWLSFLVDATLFGRRAAGPHLTNVLLHAANAVLAFLLLRRLTGTLWRSALVAALFALHPLRVESVAWVAERKGLLSALFGLLALLAYARYVEWAKARAEGAGGSKPVAPWYGLALGLFAASLMAKPGLVTLPVGMLLLDYWPLQRLANNRPGERGALWLRLTVEKIPFLLLSLASTVLTIRLHNEYEALVSLANASPAARIQNAFVSCAQYLGKAVWPSRLALPYPYASQMPVGLSILGLALVAGLSLGALLLRRRRPYIFVGWFWFLGTVLPVLGLIQWGSQTMADRFTYVPMLGLLLLVVWGAAELSIRGRIPRWACLGVVVLLLAACAVGSERQLRHWKDSESLFRHTLSVTGNNPLALNNLGAWLTVQQRPGEALVFLRQALQMNPSNADTYYNVGNALAEQGKFDEALTNFQAAVTLKPGYYQARNNLGKAFSRLGRFEAAAEQYRLALQYRPQDTIIHKNLAEALRACGKLEGAIEQYQQALALEPDDAAAHYALGITLALQNRWDEAIRHYTRALQSSPNDAEAQYNLGYAWRMQGRLDEAVRHLEQALRLRPEFPLAHYNLGCVLARQGKGEQALAHFREALRLKPDYAEASHALRELKAKPDTDQ